MKKFIKGYFDFIDIGYEHGHTWWKNVQIFLGVLYILALPISIGKFLDGSHWRIILILLFTHGIIVSWRGLIRFTKGEL